jgi:hypothetical protein
MTDTERTSEHKLKDGRTIYRTHNGFRFFLEDKKGKSTQVSESYYNIVKKNII